jgi:DcaP outer membrane protein
MTAKILIRITGVFLLFVTCNLHAQDAEKKDRMEIFGFIQMDAGYNFNQTDPNWFDVVRPTKLPAYSNQYGTDGNTFLSVRQTRLGIKNYFQTPMGELKTHFEFDMFGTGVDAGQTTIRLRHAYAELGKFGIGQTHSPFMDIDVFPNTLDYWGPNGMVFFRNVQIRYMPIKGATFLTFALERPGASADQGIYAGRIELQGVKPRFPLPDLSAEYRKAAKWGYVELAGILRRIDWVDQGQTPGVNLTGGATGWGLNLSTNVKLGANDTFRGQVVYGQGIQNYMNDAPTDVGIKNNFSDPTKPILGVALPMLGVVAFVDHTWSEKFTSSFGYSSLTIKNSDAQLPSDFRRGIMAVANVLYHPVKNLMAGVEYTYATRENYSDGWNSHMSKVQFSFKYSFFHTMSN